MRDVLIEKSATDEIPFGGRPGDFENYYDAKSGWPLNPDGGGNKYLTRIELTQLKGELLSAIRGANNGEAMQYVQAALGIVLEKLGEVAPDFGELR